MRLDEELQYLCVYLRCVMPLLVKLCHEPPRHLPCLGAVGAMWDRPHVRQSHVALIVLVVLPFWGFPKAFLPLLRAATLVCFPNFCTPPFPGSCVLDPIGGFRGTVEAGVFPNQALVPSSCFAMMDSSFRRLFQNWLRVIVSLPFHCSIASLILRTLGPYDPFFFAKV